MEWNNLVDQYREVINHQLITDKEETTIAIYNKLLENGYDHDKAVDKLIPYLHSQITEALNESEEKTPWEELLEPLMEDDIRNATYINKSKVEKMIKSCRKEFGTIPNGTEEYYQEGISTFERNLLILSQMFGLNSRQLKDIGKIWLILLYGTYNDEVYDISDAFENYYVEMAKPLLFNCNIYSNDDLMAQFKEQFPELDVNDPETKLSTYTMNFRCLQKVLDHMDLWMKKYGSNGYVTYLTKNIKL